MSATTRSLSSGVQEQKNSGFAFCRSVIGICFSVFNVRYNRTTLVRYLATLNSSPYLIQRNKEYKLKLAEQKIAAYSEFLRDFTETAVRIMHNQEVGSKNLDKQRMLARNQILLYGSDDVIKAYDKWVLFTDNGGKGGSDEDVALFGNLLLKIRQDIVGKTKVTVDDISNLNPFNRG